MKFQVYPVEFSFCTRDKIRLSPSLAGNTIRGALGQALRAIACDENCQSSRTCNRAASCFYARLFEPGAALRNRPSGFLNPPRPFVIRPGLLGQGAIFGPGRSFTIGLNLFTQDLLDLNLLQRAFDTWSRDGFGPR